MSTELAQKPIQTLYGHDNEVTAVHISIELDMAVSASKVSEKYSNDPKFLHKHVWANSVDPDHTAPEVAVWSGSTLFAILS